MRYAFRFMFILLLAFTLWTGNARSQEGLGIQIVKLGSPVAEVGGTMNYSIVVFVSSIVIQSCFDFFGATCTAELEDQLPLGFVPDVGGITANKFFPLSPPEDISGNCNVTPGNLLTCDLAVPGLFDLVDFASGQYVEIVIPGTAPLVEGTITNTATVTVDGPGFPVDLDGSDTDSFDTEVIGPGPQADLAVFKTDAPDPVIGQAGSIVTYTLAIGNAGPDDATNVVLQDLLPAGTTFISSVPGGPTCNFAPGPNAVVCSVASLSAGDVEFVTITVAPPVLSIGDPDISMLNIARVFADEADPSPGNNIVAEPTTVVAPGPDITQSDLVVTKTSPDTVIVGEPFSYVVHIFNAGPDVADNVRFRDAPFMNTLINIPGIVSSDPAICVPLAAPNFRCDLVNPLLPGQSVSFIIPAVYNGPLPLNPTPIFNVANAILGPSTLPNTIQEDPVPGNNTFVEVTNVVPPPPITTFSDLVLTKSVPDIIIPGTVGPATNTFGYSIEVANLGPDDAFNVIVTDIIPDDVTFLTFTAGCNIVMNPGSMRDELICSVGNIASGDIARVDIRAVYTGVAPLFPSFRAVFNLATADFGRSRVVQIDPDTNNNTDVGFSRALIPPDFSLSDLDVRKSAPAIIIENQEFSYFVEVTNLGPDEAQNVMLRDLIPADISINPANLGRQGCAIVVDEIVCDIGTMTNGQTNSFEFLATYTGMAPDLPGSVPVFNLATVFFDPAILPGNPPAPPTVQLDLNPANNTASAISQAIEPPPNINLVDLFVVKVDSPDPVVTEGTLTYTLFVYNFGPNDAVDVIVTDILPAGVTVSNPLPGGCVQNGQVITCNAPLIMAGTAFLIQIEVDAPMLDDDQPIMIINAARADVNPFALLESENTIQLDFAPSNNTDYEKTTVVPEPPPMSDLLILKTDTPDPVIEDDVLTYTIFVKNTGPDPAAGVLVSDWLPQEGLDLDTVAFTFSPNVDGCIQDPDVLMEPYKVECLIPSLGVEESATINVTVTTLPLPDGVEFLNIFNLAKVESIGDEINPPSADPNPLNNVVVESTLIGEFVPIADLFIIKSDSPDPVTVDQTLTYVLFVSNAGPDPATNVVVTDTLPDSVDLISATPDQGACGGLVGDTVTCNLGNLAVGAFTEIRILVTPTIPGTILNVAQVMGDEHDPKSSNNISPQTTTVKPKIFTPPDNPGEPNGNDIFVLKFVSPNPVEVGQEVTFTIIVGNNGEFGSGATVVDDLPAGLTFVSATASTGDPCNLVNGDVVCDIGTIPPLGQGQTVVVEVRAIADQTGTLPNTAFLDNVPNDPVTNNNVSIVALTVVPDISVPQPPPNPDPGDDGDGGDDGDTGGSNNSGCTVAAGSINTSSTAINFALLLLPLLVFGFRSIKRKK